MRSIDHLSAEQQTLIEQVRHVAADEPLLDLPEIHEWRRLSDLLSALDSWFLNWSPIKGAPYLLGCFFVAQLLDQLLPLIRHSKRSGKDSPWHRVHYNDLHEYPQEIARLLRDARLNPERITAELLSGLRLRAVWALRSINVICDAQLVQVWDRATAGARMYRHINARRHALGSQGAALIEVVQKLQADEVGTLLSINTHTLTAFARGETASAGQEGAYCVMSRYARSLASADLSRLAPGLSIAERVRYARPSNLSSAEAALLGLALCVCGRAHLPHAAARCCLLCSNGETP